MREKHNIVTEPTKIAGMDFEYLYEEISRDWPEKARRLQARRWRAMRRSTGDV
jgi:hypothetical protein